VTDHQAVRQSEPNIKASRWSAPAGWRRPIDRTAPPLADHSGKTAAPAGGAAVIARTKRKLRPRASEQGFLLIETLYRTRGDLTSSTEPVQDERAMIKLYASDPSRLNVFKVLRATCNAIADQIRAAQQSKPLAKTG
jgi:hypothetical protein